MLYFERVIGRYIASSVHNDGFLVELRERRGWVPKSDLNMNPSVS